MKRQWTSEEAWNWYNSRPYINGCNFLSGFLKRNDLYLPDKHDEAMRIIKKEVALAAEVGLNSFRMHLPPKDLWEKNPEQTEKYFEDFLTLCDSYGIDLMPVLFSDCLPSCFTGEDVVGELPEDDPKNWPSSEAYVLAFAKIYKDDPRISVWNIWNEAGNSHRNIGMLSLPFIKRLFEILREADVSQPLTCDCWGLYKQIEGRYNFEPGLDPIEKEVCDLSDVITFHYYGDLLHTKAYFKYLMEHYDRPLINTEWGHRPWGSFIPSTLPLFKKYNIGSYFFGFVRGPVPEFDIAKVWQWIENDDRIDTKLWMHGIYHADFTPYDQDDIDALMEMKAILQKENEEKFGKKE